MKVYVFSNEDITKEHAHIMRVHDEYEFSIS